MDFNFISNRPDEMIIEIHERIVEIYNAQVQQQQGLFPESEIRSFLSSCFSELERLRCDAIVYQRESSAPEKSYTKTVSVMTDIPKIRIVAPVMHQADPLAGSTAYTVYQNGTSALFEGQGNIFRLRKITNPGQSYANGYPPQKNEPPPPKVSGKYSMPFWITSKTYKPDLIQLLMEAHYHENLEVHNLGWYDITEKIQQNRIEFQRLLFELYIPDSSGGKPDIFYFPSYHKNLLDSHMLFAFHGLPPKAYPGIERLCSRIAYLIRKATADDMAYRANAASIAARTMCRNFAHNFGSHALLYVSLDARDEPGYRRARLNASSDTKEFLTKLQSGQTFTHDEIIQKVDDSLSNFGKFTKDQREKYEDLIDLVDYVRDRGTYQAQVSNAASFWTLNYNITEKIADIVDNFLLVTNLCRSELGKNALDIHVANLTQNATTLAAISMGAIGVQALYSILENIAKNTAKYGIPKNFQGKLDVYVFIEDDEQYPNDYRVSIESNIKQDEKAVRVLNQYLDDVDFDNMRPEYERLGLSEILVSASFLRRIKPFLIKKYLKRNQDNHDLDAKPPLLRISLSDRQGETMHSIRYVFYVPKPNNVLIISDNPEVLSLIHEDSESISVKQASKLLALISGPQKRIPRHDFIIVDNVLKDDEIGVDATGKPVKFDAWRRAHHSFLPSRFIYATADEISALVRNSIVDSIGSERSLPRLEDSGASIDENRFLCLLWEKFAASRRWSRNMYILDQRLLGRPVTEIKMPNTHRNECSVFIGSSTIDSAPSVVFSHNYDSETTRLRVRQTQRSWDDNMSSDDFIRSIYKDKEHKFVEAIQPHTWTEPLYHYTSSEALLPELTSEQLLTMFRFQEAANANVCIIDERVDQELSKLDIASKNTREPFDLYWKQRNVFRIPHRYFIEGGFKFLKKLYSEFPVGNRPSFVFIHLTLIQQWLRIGDEDQNEIAFKAFADTWSRVAVKIIIHSDRGNHDLADKWKSSIATFDALGDALQTGDKLDLINLAIASRAPSLERN